MISRETTPTIPPPCFNIQKLSQGCRTLDQIRYCCCATLEVPRTCLAPPQSSLSPLGLILPVELCFGEMVICFLRQNLL